MAPGNLAASRPDANPTVQAWLNGTLANNGTRLGSMVLVSDRPQFRRRAYHRRF
jgi:hypothetical protein